MERIELAKMINDIDISSLVQIGVDEKVRYLKNEEGINVVGCIDINGLYTKCDNSNCMLKESIDVDMNILYENIQDSEKFRLYVEDFNYDILDKSLLLKVYVKFDSYRDIETTFPSSEVVEMRDGVPLVEIDDINIRSENSTIIENDKHDDGSIPFLKSYFKYDNYNRSASLYVLKENETLEDVSTKFNIDLEEIKNMNREIEYKKGNLINIPIHD